MKCNFQWSACLSQDDSTGRSLCAGHRIPLLNVATDPDFQVVSESGYVMFQSAGLHVGYIPRILFDCSVSWSICT